MRQRTLQARLFLALVLIASPRCFGDEATFEGNWQTSFGPMQLKQKANRVTGSYSMQGAKCLIDGEIGGGRLKFAYREGNVSGEGWFRLAPDGKSFTGEWREKETDEWSKWIGRRITSISIEKGFAGLWDSTFGRMRLIKDGEKIYGIYSSEYTLEGELKKGRFDFKYQEIGISGEGWFELDDDGSSLSGKWRADGTNAWSDWSATRIRPDPNKKWLVVVEARWEANLDEREYAFGDMLKAFFNRARNVQVRRRFFNDENDLRRWCREAALLAEPVVLCIATHGTREGIQVGGRSITPDAIARSLRYCSNVQLLHFSACLMMKDKLAGKIMTKLGTEADYPISGYSTSVDWATSAVIEFMYFDLVLARGLTPVKAAKQVKILFPNAGDKEVTGANLPAAGFKILMPREQ